MGEQKTETHITTIDKSSRSAKNVGGDLDQSVNNYNIFILNDEAINAAMLKLFPDEDKRTTATGLLGKKAENGAHDAVVVNRTAEEVEIKIYERLGQLEGENGNRKEEIAKLREQFNQVSKKRSEELEKFVKVVEEKAASEVVLVGLQTSEDARLEAVCNSTLDKKIGDNLKTDNLQEITKQYEEILKKLDEIKSDRNHFAKQHEDDENNDDEEKYTTAVPTASTSPKSYTPATLNRHNKAPNIKSSLLNNKLFIFSFIMAGILAIYLFGF